MIVELNEKCCKRFRLLLISKKDPLAMTYLIVVLKFKLCSNSRWPFFYAVVSRFSVPRTPNKFRINTSHKISIKKERILL